VTGLADAPDHEREALLEWLRTRHDWSAKLLQQLDVRLDVVRRLTFHRAPAAQPSPGQGG
jgi:hypothetical protein